MTEGRHWEGDVAALNADVVDYSRLLADDFDATSDGMVALRSIVKKGVEAVGGTLVNFVGDNFMAVFKSATEGVSAAIRISSAIEQRNLDLKSTRKMRFRMGMDWGPVAVSDGHYEGDVLNIAARIQTLAQNGGLSVSGPVYRALDEPALRFRSTGQKRLKNIPEPIEIYEFVDLPSESELTRPISRLSLEIPTIAVLPIHTEGVDDPVRTSAGMIRADIMHRLTSIPELIVRDASGEIGKESVGRTARYMLETGVHQFGGNLRVYATLFDVTTMNIVKSFKEFAAVDDLLSLSDRLAEQVGTAIEVELVVGAPAGLYSELGDPAVIEKVYRGWYDLRSDTFEGWRKAVALFGEVAEARPDLTYGWVLSGFANWLGVANGWAEDPDIALTKALEQAGRATEIGDPTGMAHAVRAAVLMSNGQIEEAVKEMDTLQIVRPTCDVTYGLEGALRRYLGEWEKAVDLLDIAMRLTGINKPWYPTVKACSLFIGNRVEQAASVAESVLEYQPGNLEALLVLAAAQVELGMDRRAKAAADQIREQFPTVDVGQWIDRNPYQDRDLVKRWKADLSSIGLISTS